MDHFRFNKAPSNAKPVGKKKNSVGRIIGVKLEHAVWNKRSERIVSLPPDFSSAEIAEQVT
jgi:hypothetical protein